MCSLPSRQCQQGTQTIQTFESGWLTDDNKKKQQRAKDDERPHRCCETQRVKFRHPPPRLKSWSALQIRINKGLGLNVHSSFAPVSTRVATDPNFLVGVVDGWHGEQEPSTNTMHQFSASPCPTKKLEPRPRVHMYTSLFTRMAICVKFKSG